MNITISKCIKFCEKQMPGRWRSVPEESGGCRRQRRGHCRGRLMMRRYRSSRYLQEPSEVIMFFKGKKNSHRRNVFSERALRRCREKWLVRREIINRALAEGNTVLAGAACQPRDDASLAPTSPPGSPSSSLSLLSPTDPLALPWTLRHAGTLPPQGVIHAVPVCNALPPKSILLSYFLWVSGPIPPFLLRPSPDTLPQWECPGSTLALFIPPPPPNHHLKWYIFC